LLKEVTAVVSFVVTLRDVYRHCKIQSHRLDSFLSWFRLRIHDLRDGQV